MPHKTTIAVIFTIVTINAALVLMPISTEATAIKHVRGSGVGTVTCPDGSEIDNAQIVFGADKDKGRFDRFTSLAEISQESFFDIIDVSFHQGTITVHRYDLVGIPSRVGLCPGTSVATVATLSGPCGENVKIEFTTRNGVQGEFTGKVVCTV